MTALKVNIQEDAAKSGRGCQLPASPPSQYCIARAPSSRSDHVQVQVQLDSFFPDPGTPPRCPRVAPASCNRLSPRLSATKIESTSSSPPVHRMQPAVQVHDPVSRRTQQKPRTQQRAVYSYTLHRTEHITGRGFVFSDRRRRNRKSIDWGWWRGGGEGLFSMIL